MAARRSEHVGLAVAAGVDELEHVGRHLAERHLDHRRGVGNVGGQLHGGVVGQRERTRVHGDADQLVTGRPERDPLERNVRRQHDLLVGDGLAGAAGGEDGEVEAAAVLDRVVQLAVDADRAHGPAMVPAGGRGHAVNGVTPGRQVVGSPQAG